MSGPISYGPGVGGLGQGAGREILSQLKEATMALKDFGEAVKRAGDISDRFGTAAGQAAELGINASIKAARAFSSDIISGFTNNATSQAIAGEPFSIGGLSEAVMAAGANNPATSALFSGAYDPAKAAQDRVGAVAANVARAGGQTDRGEIAEALGFAWAQEKRARQARDDVRSVANDTMWPEAQEGLGRRWLHAAGWDDALVNDAGDWIYNTMRRVGLTQR